MKRLGKILLSVLAICLFFSAVLFYVVPRFIRAEFVEQHLIQPLEESLESPLMFEKFEFSYFPRFRVTFRNVEVGSKKSEGLYLKSEELRIEPDHFGLLFGKFLVHDMEAKSGFMQLTMPEDAPFEKLEFSDLRLRIASFVALAPMVIEFQANLGDIQDAVSGKFQLAFSDFNNMNWENVSLQGLLDIQRVDLAELGDMANLRVPLKMKEGEAAGTVDFNKEAGEEEIEFTGTVQFQEWLYEYMEKGVGLPSKPMDTTLDFNFVWYPTTEDLILKRSRWLFPMASVEINGQASLNTGEVQELRFSVTDLILEEVPHYWVFLKSAIPFNIGFSGQSQLEMSLKGTWHHLSVYANMDLTETVLTYGRFFDKPKDFPMTLTCDFLLKEGHNLAGDFSLRFSEVLAKGTFKQFDFKTGDGQLNLITNKHAVTSWGKLVPAADEYDLEGDIKVLANWEGVLKNVNDVKKIFNITLENGNFTRQSGPALNNVRLILDFDSDMGLSIKDAQIDIADAPVKLNISVYNYSGKPMVRMVVSSGELDLVAVLETLEEWMTWVPPSVAKAFETFKETFETFRSKDSKAKNFIAELQYKDAKWLIDRMGWDVYGGRVTTSGELVTEEDLTTYDLKVDLSQLSLEWLFPQEKEEEPVSQGELFVNTKLTGSFLEDEDPFKSVTGEGKVLITNGHFYTFDLINTLSGIQELKELKPFSTGKTSFDDIHANFTIDEGKILTEDLVVVSPDYVVEAEGSLAMGGDLNYRLGVYLSGNHTEKIVGPLLKKMELKEGQSFGPVTVALSGRLDKPDLQVDSGLAGDLFHKLYSRKPQRAFRNFLREELLFERAASS